MKARIRNIVRDAINKLEIEDGDVILVKQGTPVGEHRTFAQFAQLLGRSGRPRCICVIVDDFDDLSVVSKEDMEAHGWKWVGADEEE